MKNKNFRIKLLFGSLIIAFFMVTQVPAFGQTTGDRFNLNAAVDGTGIIERPITVTIATLISAILGIVGVLFLVLIIAGGIAWMTSGGNEQRITLAKKILTTAVIGLVIVMTGYSITYFIIQSLDNVQTQNLTTGGTL